jgi:hypothetical protein
MGTRNQAEFGVHVYRPQFKIYNKMQHTLLTYTLVEIY